uniref:DUF223 domain-containing protein n=2 Tax=Brassica oleracea var. oleracea TaxID=109376 RepID=A0A0D3C9B2_BRAOL
MKTVRPDEFGSPYSKDSILSIANSNDNQTRGPEFMLQLVNNSSKNSMTSYAREMRLSSSCSKFPEKYFADFSDILGGNLDHSCLVDVVGQIVNFGSLENKIIKGKDNMRLLVELRDPNNVKMLCTLWGCYAKQVYDYSRSNMSTMIICVIIFCSVKEWKGAYSISSGYNSTHILLNPTLDFIEEFKASLPDDSLALTNNDSSQWSVGTATSIRARQDLAMAFNRDLKLKKPIVEDYSYSLEEAFNKGKNETRDRYRAMLFMYQNQLEAITAKHDEEREVYRVQGKLELLKELQERRKEEGEE